MAAVPVVLSGFYIDKYGRTGAPVTVAGQLSIAGLEVGGGPVLPPNGGGGGDHIWGPTDPRPNPPIANVPGAPGYQPPITPVPPNVEVPPPGSPPSIVPGTQPVNPMVPPSAVMIEYPGIGKVVVPQPVGVQPV